MMRHAKCKHLSLAIAFSLSIFTAGCGTSEKERGYEETGTTDENYSEKLDYTITGIEPGAGIMQATEKALEEYKNLATGWKVDVASTGAMTAELGKAIKNEEPIIVTGWTPHWKFAKYDLKFLDDPKGIYGDVEVIKTIARKGLKEETPDAYKLLEQFHWEPEDMESIMLESEKGVAIEEAAKNWVRENKDKVS